MDTYNNFFKYNGNFVYWYRDKCYVNTPKFKWRDSSVGRAMD